MYQGQQSMLVQQGIIKVSHANYEPEGKEWISVDFTARWL